MKSPQDTEAERLEALGQEDEKTAVSDTTKILKAEEKKHEEQEATYLETLKKQRMTVATYTKALATLLEGKLYSIDWPQGWTRIVYPTDVGVILELGYQGRMFRSAFKATGEEVYDLNAVNTYVIRAENTVDRIMSTETQSPITKSP